MIGSYIPAPTARRAVESIRQADRQGVDAVWLTQAGVAADAMGVLAAAAGLTERVQLGTSIVPIWPRPPLLLAQQTLAIESLAPGRFRLGIGPSTAAGMEPLYGVRYHRPLAYLREYIQVLGDILHKGETSFEGRFLRARARTRTPVAVPIMASALSPGAYRLCGELTDGAISWMCPWPYLRDTALPALAQGAASAQRQTPPLVVHVPVCLSSDREAVRKAVQEQVGRYGTFPVYQAMFATAGYGDTATRLPDELIDSLVAWGDDQQVIDRLGALIAEGAGEVLAHQVFVTADEDTEQARYFELLTRASKAIG